MSRAILSGMPVALTTTLLLLLAFNTGWFVVYSANLGASGLTASDPGAVSRVFMQEAVLTNASLAAHMIAGALLTIAAPLQALPFYRRRLTRWHRRSGYLLFGLAVITGVGGLIYIGLAGTIGGWWMSLWFGIYGIAMIWSATRTVQSARAGDWASHFQWATRLIILAVGSWIFRMHYAIWVALAGRQGMSPDFTGLFDRIQVFAFFVPYLLAAEWLLRRSASGASHSN